MNIPPRTPEEFLAHWAASHGNLRRFLEDVVLPPIDASTQRAAGEAAAAAAVEQAFGIGLEDFTSGIESVAGAYQAAGGQQLTKPDPAIQQEPGAAAFFDVDNTLVQGASIVTFAVGLWRRKYFRLRDLAPIAWKQLKFRITGSENADDVASGREQALEFIRGRRVDEMVALCEEIVDSQMVERIWPGTAELANQHIAAGQQVWLVTATPVELAQILARRLGFTGALGTVNEVRDGVFTGRLIGDILHGPGKQHAVAALAAIEGLDLERCTAYSDSINDMPMLTMVGTAVAINPDRPLRKEALARGWEIRDFRNVRKAVSKFGLPALIAAAFSMGGWRVLRR
ncbi:HAD-IB family hydrolase [Corynebacterium sp. 13CS0277]|uniref:HAD family hydrolase n=1 Tax=Corynebacterium sp. 13CS0277 TaxID=2071994 RepID=UPI000D0456E7|nr:HAD-IB family hydrolase [Corynebacterium sp. 13CS0277]PRQ10681.1 HAD-IB family hydrolase [Corynebacterium sp. 13CS0277]